MPSEFPIKIEPQYSASDDLVEAAREIRRRSPSSRLHCAMSYWSARECDTLKKLWARGVPTPDIADRLGRTTRAIRAKAASLGLSALAAPDYTPAEEAELAALWARGLSGAQIARKLRRSRDGVLRKARRMGLARRR